MLAFCDLKLAGHQTKMLAFALLDKFLHSPNSKRNNILKNGKS
jgi:hypothetical protein